MPNIGAVELPRYRHGSRRCVRKELYRVAQNPLIKGFCAINCCFSRRQERGHGVHSGLRTLAMDLHQARRRIAIQGFYGLIQQC
jgi:hypothetical protein